MIVHQVPAPESYRDFGWDQEKLDDQEIKEVESLGVDETWYWYSCGCYEGAGNLLMRRGDEWQLCDLGHCSCFGPTHGLSFDRGSGCSLRGLWGQLSGGFKREARYLFEAAQPGGPWG